MGTAWSKSGLVERDGNDAVAGGAKAYFFVGGTTTPLVVYQDSNETTPTTSPVLASGTGRWPVVFIPFCASYDVQVTTSGGTQLYYHLEIPNADPVNQEITVDANALIATGDFIWSPKDATRSGFVRANGRTMGDASSGASERANADTADLFAYLWNNLSDANAPVSTGRGLTATADYAAHKTITLPDLRGSGLVGLDTMGNSAASRLGSATFASGSATAPGSICGENTHTLTSGELAAHTHTITNISSHTHSFSATSGTQSANHTHGVSGNTGTVSSDHTHGIGSMTTQAMSAGSGFNAYVQASGTVTTSGASSDHTHAISLTSGSNSADHTHSVSGTSGSASISGTSDSTGSGTAHNTVSRSGLGTFYIKL